jgi:hypothetical protein
MLKTVATFTSVFLISTAANSQSLKLGTFDGQKVNRPNNSYQQEQKYSCELSGIGKLVVKPLVKDSLIQYDNTFNGKFIECKSVQSGVSIIKESSGENTVIRFQWIKNKVLNLSFIHSPVDGNCIYHLKLFSDNGVEIISFLLDGNGTILNRNDKEPSTNEERMSAQREVNAWLSYFK